MKSQNKNGKRGLIKSLHYLCGVILSVFIAFHLINHLFALDGPEKHIQVMDRFRLVYRHPVVETFVLLIVLFQVVTGIRLIYKRNAVTIAEKIQVYSGLYLSFFLIAHVGAVLSGRYIEHLDTNFYFAAAGLNYYPATFIFIPYYFLAVASISLHVSVIHYLKTGSAGAAIGMATVGMVAAMMIILAFTGNFSWLDIPQPYEQFIRSLI
ncbi:hypothetical protein [Xanthocytophaga agilis]|uniref:Uncharacterized protein n=1 Tax=Xanthocytophaga agilis TaxID=3048010 RepID=A0AAE3UCP5_9BACT|nr:hypothetical protein [Xanthocytophaga agilis]MDJ1500310.1 hypothetical protein [Xanthocytophaga agilis]